MSPKRIQRKRTKGWRMPEGAVYVGRPSKWANPYHVRVYGEMAAELFEKELRSAIERPWSEPHAIEFRVIAESIEKLRGRDLVCWCDPAAPCHADVLLELASDRCCNCKGSLSDPTQIVVHSGPGPVARFCSRRCANAWD